MQLTFTDIQKTRKPEFCHTREKQALKQLTFSSLWRMAKIISRPGASVEMHVGRICGQTGVLFLKYIIYFYLFIYFKVYNLRGTMLHAVRHEGVVLAIQ